MQQKSQTLSQTNNTVLKHYKKNRSPEGTTNDTKDKTQRQMGFCVFFRAKKMNLKRTKTQQETGKIEQLKRKKRSKEIKRIEKKGVKIKWKM